MPAYTCRDDPVWSTARLRFRVPTAGAGTALPRPVPTIGAPVFLFFSNRLGCFGSLVLSLAVTAVLILVLWR